jgi:hypothetical protein
VRLVPLACLRTRIEQAGLNTEPHTLRGDHHPRRQLATDRHRGSDRLRVGSNQAAASR